MTVPVGTTGAPIHLPRGAYMAIAAFTAVAWYNVAELNIQVFLTFKRHRGLYFWSLLISSYGCVLHALGFLLKMLELTTYDYISVTILTVGWYCMVTGQAVVLYSRLHLVVREQKVLRGILIMIILDAILFHIPTTVLTYGSNSPPYVGNIYTKPFNIVEKIQMTAFCIQEFIISGVYVWCTIRLLRPVYHGRTRKVMMQLIWINLIIIGMDVCLLAMEYSNTYYIEATLKAMVYSIKLKLEFAVLNQLMTLANSSVNSHQQLHIEDRAEKPPKPPTGRSKSTEYISSKYEKPSKKQQRLRPVVQPSNSAFHMPEQDARLSVGHYDAKTRNNMQWIPTLDRKCVVETRHVELSPSHEGELNVFTNPAAHYKISRGGPSHDGIGVLDALDDEDESIGPLDDVKPSSQEHGTQKDLPRINVSDRIPSGRGTPINGRRRAPPPPSLNLDNGVMPNGLIRSTRPSVSEWGRGPDSEGSPSCEEVQLRPYELSAMPRSPGSVRVGRQMARYSMARHSMGIDFVTSALHDRPREYV